MSGSAATTTGVRAMRWQDLHRVAVLEQELYPDDAWSRSSWWAELALRPRRDYLVVEGGGLLLGYAGSNVDVAGGRADVMTLGVAAHARGRGLGDALLRELHARAVAAGAQQMLLEVREDNVAARALYGRHGYRELHRRTAYYRTPQGPVDALVLGTPLPLPRPLPLSPTTAAVSSDG